MNRNDIIRMAREAGLYVEPHGGGNWAVPLVPDLPERVEHFSALVAAAERDRIADESKRIIKRAERRGAEIEREACAQVCEEKSMVKGGEVFAAKIRARGEE